MVLRICFAALLAAILVAASVPTLVQSTSPAYAAAAEKEKAKKAKKAPSAKQKAARQPAGDLRRICLDKLDQAKKAPGGYYIATEFRFNEIINKCIEDGGKLT